MYASIRRYVGNTELADALRERSPEIISVISAVTGFRAYYLVGADDGAASITICVDAEGAEESNRIAAAWIAENMPEHASAAPQVSAGEVKAWTSSS